MMFTRPGARTTTSGLPPNRLSKAWTMLEREMVITETPRAKPAVVCAKGYRNGHKARTLNQTLNPKP
jgi:hypothetical protein